MDNSQLLFEKIAIDLKQQGFSINSNAVPISLCNALLEHLQEIDSRHFKRAGVGRSDSYQDNDAIRRDHISWIEPESDAGKRWLDWADELQRTINRALFLGLHEFESHFSHYAPSDFYRRHFDAFKGQENRVLSIIVYLNHNWHVEDGGELLLYQNDDDDTGLAVMPEFAKIVAFLSEEFAHEVLPAKVDRFSIAGWFRVQG